MTVDDAAGVVASPTRFQVPAHHGARELCLEVLRLNQMLQRWDVGISLFDLTLSNVLLKKREDR